MRRMVTVCLLLLITKSAIAAQLPRELKPRYDGLIKSITKLDIKSYGTYFAKDFSFTDGGGLKLNRSQALKQEQDIFKTCKSAKCTFSAIKVRNVGDTIIVDYDLLTRAVLTDGSPSTVHEVATDTWKKINGAWLVVNRVDSVMEIKG